LCHLASDMKYAGAVYEARTYGSVRGMRRKPHPTRYAFWKVRECMPSEKRRKPIHGGFAAASMQLRVLE